MNELKPCPFCGSTNLHCGGFSISADGFINCEDCGAGIEFSVPWLKNETEKEHDKRLLDKCKELWNKRTGDTEPTR